MATPPTLFVIDSRKNQIISDNTNISEYNISAKRELDVAVLPIDLRERIHDDWKIFQNTNNYATNNSTYFFDSYDKNTNTDMVNSAPFEYAYCFGRNIKFNEYAFFADNHGFNALSSICLLKTVDKKLVLGIKKNMDNKISGFSGYIKSSDFENNRLKIQSYISRTLKEELDLDDTQIEIIHRTGQIFSPDIIDEKGKSNIKGFNNTFIVDLKVSSESLSEKVKESIQFKKELLFIKDDISDIINFISDNHRNLSIHSIGAFYNYLSSYYSESVANKLIDTIGTESLILKLNTKNYSATAQEIIRSLTPYKWILIGNSKIDSYSVAPQIWNALFESRNIPVICTTFGSDNRQDILQYLHQEKNNKYFLGCNVARPWKGSSFLTCDKVEPIAERVETTNTIIKIDAKLFGYNTDGVGIVKSILKYKPIKGKNILLLGAGGAAKTVPHYLLGEKPNNLIITDINAEKSKKLLRIYESDYKKMNCGILVIDREHIDNIFSDIDIIINATPSGSAGSIDLAPLDDTLLHSLSNKVLVAEMVYNPYYTKLLKYAKNKDCKISPGIDMLVEQAVESFKLRFESDITVEEKALLKKTAKNILINIK